MRVISRFLLAVALSGMTVAMATDNREFAKLKLSSEIPGDFFSPLEAAARDLDGLQHDFDVYSWQTFIALNWPTKPDGEADSARRIGEGTEHVSTGVWEYWRSVDSIFLEDGSKPAAWGNKGPSLATIEEPFDTGPLIDRNGRYAQFDILVNRPMFEFIVDHNLYFSEGQNEFKRSYGNIVFPCGREKVLDQKAQVRQVLAVGSILVKVAWKVLSATEIASGRFYTRKLGGYSAAHQKGGATVLGLVGMHIVHKSEDVPEWNWSTFEQVDNVSQGGSVIGHGAANSFFTAAREGLPVNTPPAPPWDGRLTEPEGRRSRVVRIQPMSEEVKRLNAEAQTLLRLVNPSSVWQYYQLISTQWPTRPARVAAGFGSGNEGQAAKPRVCDVLALSPADIPGGPAPLFLGNSTLESYIQSAVPNVSSSCMDCHANATSESGEFSDFTYILTRAKPHHLQGAR